MIITLNPVKDTYVTNLNTQYNSGSLANVGHAATIDLFKLYNENKYSNSWVLFTFSAVIADSKTLVLTDAYGTTKTFEFDTEANPGNITAGNVRININGETNHNNYASIIAAAINAETTLKITAANNTNNELLLKQDKSGESGDTEITLPVGGGMASKSGRNKFERIEYSVALLKFDLSSIKSEYVKNYGSSIFSQNKTKFKAKLVLKDVNTGNKKPKNYQLDATPLLKNFDEGIGKDTIHFSDSDYSNFVNMNSSNLWSIKEYVSKGASLDINGTSFTSNIDDIGNKDIEFDVTSYIQGLLNASTDYGILIKFTDTYLFNQVSYFVKRFGSRHLINKTFVPELKLILDDSDYRIPENAKVKKRYLNNQEKFYLYNLVNGKLQNFSTPTSNDVIELKVGNILFNKSSNSVTDFKGETIEGIKEVIISNSELSRYNESISSKVLSSGSLKETIEWYYVDDNTTADESIVSGSRYKITNVGDTNWSSLGAESGSLYELFTATANGPTNGTGIVKKVNTILSESVECLLSETTKDINHRSLNVSIRIEDNVLVSRNGIQSVEVFFIDRLKQYDSVKIPYDIPSENLGDVYYKIIDSDSNKVLIDYEVRSTLGGSENPGGTLMFFDGEKYIFDMYIPSSYKNKRIHFEFFQYDNINKIKKYIKSNDLAFRIK